MNRSLKLSILMALALGSTQAAAVEFGQAHVKSALGEPLVVEIPVTQASPAELQSLSAQLASNEEFAKIGGERPTVPLTFAVADVHGHKVIRITSSVSVDDPYLDLLVQVTSSTGSSVREFPILLDPPGKVEQAAASSAPTRRRAPAGEASAPSGTAPSAPRHAESAASPHVAVRNGQYTVQRGQTLSHVAVETAPAGVDKDQMMLALKAANPDAFYRDNINALKAGAVLRVPSHDDAVAIAAAEAAATVRQQDSDWRNGSVGAAPVAVAAGGTRSNASVAPTASSHADRLALVPAGGEGQSAGGANGKGAGSAAIRQELQRSQETLSSLEQQSNELKSRLKDLEDLNTKNQRLLSLKDDEIADLQKKLAEARKSAGLPPAAAAAPAAAPAPAKPVQPVAAASTHAAPAPTPAPASLANANPPASAPGAAASAAHPAVVTTPLGGAHAAPKPASRPLHRVAPPAVEEEPWYTQPWALGAGGLVVVLAVVGLLLRRGKSGAKPAKAPLAPPKGSLADRFGTADEDHPGGPDPDQDELLDQLAEQPDDIGLHLELVSLYYTRRDVEHFEAAAEAMHAHITDPDQPEWQDVMHMGEDLAPGHPLFAHGTGSSSAHEEQAPLHHFDLDSYGAKPDADATVVRNVPPQPSKVSEYHFDFDLTPHHADALSQPAPTTAKPEVEQEPVSTWHFDEPAETEQAPHADHVGAADHVEHAGHEAEADFGELHDDPIDTKLDLARAYLDMGDPDGARAMLDEVMQEGSQMQKDVARTLMAKIH
ncbi:MAG TPA: FimV/HubP family polar landmark protein [Dyella sp.]|uniref:FimV/HubP family polar landmark protein n=1 Tax=Dyella sp. TaxID=1869338 RepID=UPI002CEFEDF9|nr:FimV/HubP family polar landmark protein [Dyella sp.]HTV84318.1 FimV/HubP family polar landmark protein [Dyella sp.]